MTRDEAVKLSESTLGKHHPESDWVLIGATHDDVADLLLEVAAQARREALEEAVQACERRERELSEDRAKGAWRCAIAIRRLMKKP